MVVDLGGRMRINAIEPATIEIRMLLAGFNNNPGQLEELKLCHPVGEIG
jgi:hypothetical protein